MKIPHVIWNLLFYIGLFFLLFGIANTLFKFIEVYELPIIYISYLGLFSMICGTPYPERKYELSLDIEKEEEKREE